jgi:hypothetical protein
MVMVAVPSISAYIWPLARTLRRNFDVLLGTNYHLLRSLGKLLKPLLPAWEKNAQGGLAKADYGRKVGRAD